MADYLDTQDPEMIASMIAKMRVERPRLIERAGGNERLGLYLAVVDLHIRKLTGHPISHLDLADFPWTAAFADQLSPREAAKQAITADGLF